MTAREGVEQVAVLLLLLWDQEVAPSSSCLLPFEVLLLSALFNLYDDGGLSFMMVVSVAMLL